ncbi:MULTISPECIES: Ppx/GppA family phosphatase [Acetobacter]|uniref:Ppx/GppA family phosphatase n=1 Tax=Acetobacter thailandicus TaxID=1502842 RepID=A0ABT3QF09_9PROT|nr:MULTISPECIES: Ppx/GppA family phosphatase [Acetobacter]MBS0960014.1 Ppx/GppA family phosphatase [Acetobacter thailandicus]MBS0979343.1 Ppx/GppA family phosphatase [Acetobacter thailandicus]MBS1002462.1 Ppx/GppA family phosphatase [Acetobacter thailandicus]MCX2563877.1 Ppx/GppA family phosphatase [Acetobacter thailandicus]NHN95052.1 Ppx/GppA family phosphatase [Acetobacter thailandicus]
MQNDIPRRSAVVDLGSNSVRLVVFEGVSRNPVPIFNEKAVLRLGKGLTQTGMLNEEGVTLALDVLKRFHAIARAMHADPFEILATAAVRDARNGPGFIDALRSHMPGVPIRILSGEEEADHSAIGVMCGIPGASGIVADIGGGSLELINLTRKGRHDASTLPLGVIRLGDRSQGDIKIAKQLADDDIDNVRWLSKLKGSTLYLVGGAFRALARLHIARMQYPLNIIHYYTLDAEEAREMTGWLLHAPRRGLERLSGSPKKRLSDIPFAATVLRRLLRKIQPERVVFCVDGLREGWYMLNVAPDCLEQDPMEVVAQDMCLRLGRSMKMPGVLLRWTDSLFIKETKRQNRLRRIACRISDVGSHDHPEYRAEQTYWRVLRLQGTGFDHKARAWLALALAVRYSAVSDEAYLSTSRILLEDDEWNRAIILGQALRLAYSVAGGTAALLEGTELVSQRKELVLRLSSSCVAVKGDSVRRGLARVGQAMSLPVRIEEADS